MSRLTLLTLLATTALTTNALAVTVSSWDEFKSALGSQTDITLGADIEVGADLGYVEGGTVIDGGGNSLNGNGNRGFVVRGDESLTIRNFKDIYGFSSPYDDGAVFQLLSDNSELTILDSTFTDNYADETAGVAFMQSHSGKLTVKGSNFINNVGEYEAGVLELDYAREAYIENSKFIGNKNNNWGYNGPGAIFWGVSQEWTEVDPVIYNSYFEGNSGAGLGGALYVEGFARGETGRERINIVDTDFVGNNAEAGGAIMSAVLDVNLYAHNKDVLFDENYTNDDVINNGSDICVDEGSLYLVADKERKIVFNGVVAGDVPENSFVNVNKEDGQYTLSDGETYTVTKGGEVQFNGGLAWITANLYDGTVAFGQNNKSTEFEGAVVNVNGNIVLNTVNGMVDEITADEDSAFNIADNVNWEFKLDVDLENEKSDILLNSHNGTNSSVNLSQLNIFKDTDAGEVWVRYADSDINGKLKDGYTITTSKNTYEISLKVVNDGSHDGNGSYLTFTQNVGPCQGGLNCAVLEDSDVYSVTEDDEHFVPFWHKKSGADKNYLNKDMDIFGNGKGIYAEGIDGIIVKDGTNLTINTVKDWHGFKEAVVVEEGGSLTVNNSNFSENDAGRGAIVNEGGEVNLNGNITFSNQKTDIYANGGEINANGNITFDGAVYGENGAEFNIAGGNINFNDLVSGDGFTVTQTGGNVFVEKLKSADYALNGGVLTPSLEENLRPDNMAFGDGTLNIVNGRTGTVTIGSNAELNGKFNITVDLDMASETMDQIIATSAVDNGGTINVSSFNIIGESTAKELWTNFTKGALQNYVTTDVTNVNGPIYRYNVEYLPDAGDFHFYVGDGADSFNPGVLAGPVAAQAGGYLVMLNSFDEAFRNMDMYHLQTPKRRAKLNNGTPQDKWTFWVKPFSTYEDVWLTNGPRVDNRFHGVYVGAESTMNKLDKEWDGVWTVYAGSNNAYQKYKGGRARENTGTLGVVGMVYNGNFFSGATINGAYGNGKAQYEGGPDHFKIAMWGVANKTGYNFELDNGRFVIQPHYLLSYSWIDIPTFTTRQGARITSDELKAVQVEPAVKFIANLDNDWQPYGLFGYVRTFIDKTDFQANEVSLPEMSVKPYWKYGLGVRKTWNDNTTAYIQGTVLEKGRRGINVQAGFNIPLN